MVTETSKQPTHQKHVWHPSYLYGSVKYWWCSCGCGGVSKQWMGDPKYQSWQRDWEQEERERRRRVR